MIQSTTVGTITQSGTTPKRKKSRNKNILREFLQGAALYALCISLPAFLGVTVRFYENKVASKIKHRDAAVYPRFASKNWTSPHSFKMNSQKWMEKHVCGPYSFLKSSTFCGTPDEEPMTTMATTTTTTATTITATANMTAPLKKEPEKRNNLNAVMKILIMSISMALVRILLVYSLIHGEIMAPENLGAFTRCKSMHLLNEYEEMEKNKKKNAKERKSVGIWRRLLGSPVNVGSSQDSASKSTTTHSHQLSTSRYATAVFRLLYTFLSSTLALRLFRHASFWPKYLFGLSPHSSTKNCWDLSGSIVGTFDTDFDHLNPNLQSFFILSASYHLQSLCFHLVSIFLLLFSSSENRMTSIKSSMKSYARPLVEHLISLSLISACFIFSSLRRLGAVGLFTLDFSSIFLHLLQICLNKEVRDDGRGWWNQKTRRIVVMVVQQGLVIPTFLYCRFFIFPFIIMHSSLYESQDWLNQMEHAFSPKWSKTFYVSFNGFLVIILGLNLVLFKRLLFHLQLRAILREK